MTETEHYAPRAGPRGKPKDNRVNVFLTDDAYAMLEELRTTLHPTFKRRSSEVVDTAIRLLYKQMQRGQHTPS